jgi:hypothetical protein
VSSVSTFTSADTMRPVDQARVILALHESVHTDVTTIEQAFAAADQHQINLYRFYEPAAARTFLGVEYGAGDNSYGAIYYWDTTERVAAIHDGDLDSCTEARHTCLLGSTYNDLKTSPAFTATSTKLVKTAGQLTGNAATQALTAIRVAYADATSLADGLTKIDAGGLNVVTYTHVASGRLVDAYEYGAGDNSYGEVFVGGALTVAAAINDGDFYGCGLFAE